MTSQLTSNEGRTYTLVVRRLLVSSLAIAFAATSSGVSTLHTHVYLEHDHPEHHHGLASHEHHTSRVAHTQDDEHGVIGESCEDPGEHAVSISTGAVSSASPELIAAKAACAFVGAALVPTRSLVDRHDVRAHGPPSHRTVPARAPPSIPA